MSLPKTNYLTLSSKATSSSQDHASECEAACLNGLRFETNLIFVSSPNEEATQSLHRPASLFQAWLDQPLSVDLLRGAPLDAEPQRLRLLAWVEEAKASKGLRNLIPLSSQYTGMSPAVGLRCLSLVDIFNNHFTLRFHKVCSIWRANLPMIL